MKNLRLRFERFCFRHRNWGVQNLMLYLVIGSAVVYLFTIFTNNSYLYSWLCFDVEKILQGQVWRLFSYALTMENGNIFFTLMLLVCYYSLGRAMENVWGTFRFNLFYLTGILMMDAYALLVRLLMPEWSLMINGVVDVSYLNMSLFLGYATLYPDTHFLLMFIIPVKAWIFALVDLALTLWQVFYLLSAGAPFFIGIFPVVVLGNYFLFFGKDVLRVIPMSWRANARRLFRKKPKTARQKTGTIPFPSAGSYEASTATVRQPYTHRCTVCGRTDVSHPQLEFRYCSKCKGYFCYCEDHISDHTHIE